MRHFPLLGSVFRASIKRQKEVQDNPESEFHKQKLPSRVGMRVNTKVMPSFPKTSYSQSRSTSAHVHPTQKVTKAI